ncbi:MAG: ATP-binding cassette domain-containing protein [Planctomycetota bacterium]|nr:MAG: ATP-binding cassette domain-containing protein [Planctomycetota bacterium]
MKFQIEARVRRPTGWTLDVRIDCDADSLGLVGPSGSGKSTLLDAIAGIEPGAKVLFDGRDLSNLPLHHREIGYLTQDALLFPHLTVRQNLAYSPTAGPPDDVARALGIAPLLDRMPRNLSGGERRRVALARAIVSRPRVLLMDEPFAGLDEARRREALSLLSHVRQTFAIPMILVSHLADEVIGLTEQAVRLDEGKVAAAGPSSTLLRASETRMDNFLSGVVTGPRRASVDGVELTALIPEGVSGAIRLGCYAHDILLASSPPEGLSARNVFPVRVAAVIPTGDAALVELTRPRLRALLTAEGVAALRLRAGSEAYCVLKAASIVYLGPA